MDETESPGERIYSMSGVARALGVSFGAVRGRWERGNHPTPDFHQVTADGRTICLWNEAGLELWRALIPEPKPRPRSAGLRSRGLEEMPATFSDHNAVNQVGRHTVTWRLWCQPYTGGARFLWWFSTPEGWYTSTDGRSWMSTGEMRRPAGIYRLPSGTAGSAAQRGADRLRGRLSERRASA